MREQVASTIFGNKIAMPHPIEACAKRTVISVGILNQSILWGSGQAQLIFMLAVKKEDMKYLNSFFDLTVRLVDDEGLVRKLLGSENLAQFKHMNLKELICPKLILCDVDAKDFQDALRQMAGHLKKEGYVEEGYLDMLLERERKFPTGLCTKPFAVAMPHTEPDHVIKPCIAVAKLRRPVEFHEMVNDQNTVDVRFIFNLVLQKTEQQLELLQKIISIFSDKEAMEQLEKEQEPEKIAEILEHTKIGINT